MTNLYQTARLAATVNTNMNADDKHKLDAPYAHNKDEHKRAGTHQ